MGWGGIVAAGLAGAAEGVGQAGYEDAIFKQKEDAIKLRDATLAQIAQQTHTANAQSDIDLKNKNAPLETEQAVARQDALAPGNLKAATDAAQAKSDIEVGAGRSVGGAILNKDGTWTVPPKKEATDEDKAYNRARIDELNARADAERERGKSYGSRAAKEDTHVIPKPTWVKQDDGTTIEPQTGYRQINIEGKPGVAESGWGPWKKDARDEQPPKVKYLDDEGNPKTRAEFEAAYEKQMAPGRADRARRDAGSEPAAQSSTAKSEPAARSFKTEAEAASAGLKPGTRVTIGGVSGTWQ